MSVAQTTRYGRSIEACTETPSADGDDLGHLSRVKGTEQFVNPRAGKAEAEGPVRARRRGEADRSARQRDVVPARARERPPERRAPLDRDPRRPVCEVPHPGAEDGPDL